MRGNGVVVGSLVGQMECTSTEGGILTFFFGSNIFLLLPLTSPAWIWGRKALFSASLVEGWWNGAPLRGGGGVLHGGLVEWCLVEGWWIGAPWRW